MKRLIVCCDGTWKSEGNGHASNVWKLHSAIAHAGGGVVQRPFYQAGVGSDVSRSIVARAISRYGGGMFGWGLDDNIQEAYCWLVREYQPGDELWFFGFSRGAYTARSLVGLIRNCGILRPEHQDQSTRAVDLYRARDPKSHPDAPQSHSFRSNYSFDVPEIAFLGVWDTVGALGVPSALWPLAWLNRRYRFHDVELSSRVKYACHAVAVDERRPSFKPTLWSGKDAEQRRKLQQRTTVHQTWFIGVHSDVGGGYEQAGLSDITLKWMIDHAQTCHLSLDPAQVEALKPASMATLHDSRWLLHKLPWSTRWRKITPGRDRQSVHPTALERLRTDPAYKPRNLQEALGAAPPEVPPDTPEAVTD